MSKLGRPLAMTVEDRRQEIFNVAEKLFGEQGFEHVTMSQIAIEAGMSKKTLYVYFSDKRELLKSLVSSSYIWSDDQLVLEQSSPIEYLKQCLITIATHVLSERHIKLCRLAIAEQVNIEGSTQTFYEMGISTSRNHLMHAINQIPESQLKLQLSTEVMSDLLFGATIAKPFIDFLLIAKEVDFVEINNTISEAIENCFDSHIL